jgi:hypothetical protein
MICVTLLARLGSLEIFSHYTDLLLSVLYNVGTKNMSLSSLIPEYRSSSITNSIIEDESRGDGCIDLLNFKNSEGLGGEDVYLNMRHGFGAFIRHLSPIILRLLLVSQFKQHLPEHLGDLASNTSVVLELVNISI